MNPRRYSMQSLISAHDGDTYWMHVDLGFYTYVKANIRLKGYDAHEIRNNPDPSSLAKAVEARDLAVKVINGPVLIESYRSRTGSEELTLSRWVANVYVGGHWEAEKYIGGFHFGELLREHGLLKNG